MVSVVLVPVQVMLQWQGDPSKRRSKSSGIVFSSIHFHSVHFWYRMSTLCLCLWSILLLLCLKYLMVMGFSLAGTTAAFFCLGRFLLVVLEVADELLLAGVAAGMVKVQFVIFPKNC